MRIEEPVSDCIELASPAIRLIAGFVDIAAFYLGTLIIGIAVAYVRPVRSWMGPLDQDIISWSAVVCTFGLPAAGVFVLPTSLGAQTPGQYLASIRSARYSSREPLGLFRAVLLLFLSVLNAPILLVLGLADFTDLHARQRRLWHDRLTGTVVMLYKPRGRGITISCNSCGYDLRGSLKSGICPECGKAFDARELESRLDGEIGERNGDAASY